MPKLIGNWQKSHSVLAEQADMVLHTGIQAFKFPDNSQVHITCNVQVSVNENRELDVITSTLSRFVKENVSVSVKPLILRSIMRWIAVTIPAMQGAENQRNSNAFPSFRLQIIKMPLTLSHQYQKLKTYFLLQYRHQLKLVILRASDLRLSTKTSKATSILLFL